MRIYFNLDGDANGDHDVVSDGYKLEKIEVFQDKKGVKHAFEGVVTQIQSRMIVVGEANVDIGCGNAFGGKNEDEEEGGVGAAPVEKTNDLINAFHYEQIAMGKAGIKEWGKNYAKKISDKLQGDEKDRFKKGFTAFFKYLLSTFTSQEENDEFAFYTLSDYNQEGTLIFSRWLHETDEAPVFWYLLDGLGSYKV